MHWKRGVALLVGVLCAAAGCTPINEVNRATPGEGSTSENNTKLQPDAAAESSEASVPKATGVGKVVTQATACSDEGASACEGHGVRAVSVCKDGKWLSDTSCKMNERCDSATGKCAPVAAVCAGQEAGAEFCDGDKRLVCDDLVAARELTCAANELCSRKDGKVSCTCAPGAVPAAQGMGCELISGCGADGRGCDPLTRCISNGCSPCPTPGYVGDGSKGCIPQLVTLSLACGSGSTPRTLELTSGVYEYRTSVPVLCQVATLTATGPADTQLEVDGVTVEPGASWSSPLLRVGDNPVKLVVTAQSGRSSAYQLKIERTGSKCDYIKASNADVDDSFGFRIAAEGDTMLVGAPFEGSDGSSPDNNALRNAGAAYVFKLEGDKWVEKQLIKAEAPQESDMFGAAVAFSGDIMVVGAPRYNLMLFKVVPPTGPGHAYVFTRQGAVWKQEAELKPTEGSGADMFGFHVAVHGQTVLVGAPYDSTAGSHAGAVYSFERSNGTWAQQKIVASSATAEASLGVSVAIEGDVFVAGAMQDGSAAEAAGSAYVFARNGGQWSEKERLQAPSPKALATFGMTVAINSGRVLVTAPGLDLRGRQTPAGEAYLFQVDPGSSKWTVKSQFHAAPPRSIDLFGGSAALTTSGVVVGANGDGSSSRGVDGDPNRTDAHLAGAAYLFGPQGSEYVQSAYLKAFNADAEDNYGHSITATETYMAVGSPFESGGQHGVHRQDDVDASNNAARASGVVYVYR